MKPLITFIKLSVIISFCGLVTCEKDETEITSEQSICFEHYAINWARGFQYIHWMIDTEGNVRISHAPDSILWITEYDIDKRVSTFDSVIYKVNLDELILYIKLIPSASKGRIICEEKHRADFGGYIFNCFFSDKIILLGSMSDNEDCFNSEKDAITIYNWLKDLDVKIYS